MLPGERLNTTYFVTQNVNNNTIDSKIIFIRRDSTYE